MIWIINTKTRSLPYRRLKRNNNRSMRQIFVWDPLSCSLRTPCKVVSLYGLVCFGEF
jgi:hypothetical protein